MFARITFLLVLTFWLLMNFLLWRSQTGHQTISQKVPVEIVWQKILTAPDNSSLEILHYNERIGFCTWSATIGEAPRSVPREPQSDEYLPEELTTEVTGYTLGLEGRAALSSNSVLHLDCLLKLSTNQDWQEFHGRVNLRPTTWDLLASAAQQRLKLQVTDDSGVWQKVLKFSDLKDPEALMEKLGGDVDVGMIGALIPGGKNGLAVAARSLRWQAYADTMQFGHSRVGVYRLETYFLGHKIFIFVSKVGEILWVELPDKIVFRNEAFGHF